VVPILVIFRAIQTLRGRKESAPQPPVYQGPPPGAPYQAGPPQGMPYQGGQVPPNPVQHQ
jgi:hypothetical protein